MEKNEKIIEKIKNLMSLASNNPSKAEAEAAALKAQELMAKYHIDMESVDAEEREKIDEMYVEVGMGKKWKYQLARVISRNFCCRHFLFGKDTIAFYGYKTDIKIASHVFLNLFLIGDKLVKKEYLDEKGKFGTACGIYNSFVSGFVAGIGSVLDEQCRALMIVTPPEVEDSYKDRSIGFVEKSFRNVRTSSYKTWQNGYNAGRDAMQARAITG